METSLTVETAMFQHKDVKPHFINPCCFGEDFAAWLGQQLSPLEEAGFTFSQSIQEDYGWGLRAWHGKDQFWVAISYLGSGPQEAPVRWLISGGYDPGLNPIMRITHEPNKPVLQNLRDHVRKALESNTAIKIVPTLGLGR
jgi:hypothetical protein